MLKRASINALIAQKRGDLAPFCYDKSRRGQVFWMLFDTSPEGRWSHIERATREEVWQQADQEAAAAPYATDFRLAGKLLLLDLNPWELLSMGQTIKPLLPNESDEAALLICLAWLRDVAGLIIERWRIIDDLPDSDLPEEHEEH